MIRCIKGSYFLNDKMFLPTNLPSHEW